MNVNIHPKNLLSRCFAEKKLTVSVKQKRTSRADLKIHKQASLPAAAGKSMETFNNSF